MTADRERYSPSQIIAIVLGKMKETAETHHQRSVQAGSCCGASLLSRRTEKGDQGRWERSPVWWFCKSSTKRQLLHSRPAWRTKTMARRRRTLMTKFETSQQCAPTRMTTRPYFTGGFSTTLLAAGNTRALCLVPVGATPGSAMNRQGRLPVMGGTGRGVPSDPESPSQRKRSDRCRDVRYVAAWRPLAWPAKDLVGRARPRCTTATTACETSAWKPLGKRTHTT